MEKIMDMETLCVNLDNVLTAALFMKMMDCYINNQSTSDIEGLFPDTVAEAAERAEAMFTESGIEVPQDGSFQAGLCYKLAECCLAGEVTDVAFAAAVQEQLDDERFCRKLRDAVKARKEVV